MCRYSLWKILILSVASMFASCVETKYLCRNWILTPTCRDAKPSDFIVSLTNLRPILR